MLDDMQLLEMSVFMHKRLLQRRLGEELTTRLLRAP